MILSVKLNNMNWSIPIERRFTVVRGDSGKGKTVMIDLISNRNNGADIDFPLPIAVCRYDSWRALVSSSRNTLLVFDDLEIVESREFVDLISETEGFGNFYLIFSREDIGMDKFSGLSIAVSSILRFVISSDGLRHYTEPYYKFVRYDINDMECNRVISEDETAGKQFLQLLYHDAVCNTRGGKSRITYNTLAELGNENCSGILVMVDMAAFGCHMDIFYDLVLSENKGRVYIDINYECFEELLLMTKYLCNDDIVKEQFSNLEVNANKYNSWETYFEKLIANVANRYCIKYHHGKNLSFCWSNECTECKKTDKESCEFYCKPKKVDYLLKDTKYDKLLRLRDRMK